MGDVPGEGGVDIVSDEYHLKEQGQGTGRAGAMRANKPRGQRCARSAPACTAGDGPGALEDVAPMHGAVVVCAETSCITVQRSASKDQRASEHHPASARAKAAGAAFARVVCGRRRVTDEHDVPLLHRHEHLVLLSDLVDVPQVVLLDGASVSVEDIRLVKLSPQEEAATTHTSEHGEHIVNFNKSTLPTRKPASHARQKIVRVGRTTPKLQTTQLATQ